MLTLAATAALAETQTKATQDKPWQVYVSGATMNTSDDFHSVNQEYYSGSTNLFFTGDSKTTSAKKR